MKTSYPMANYIFDVYTFIGRLADPRITELGGRRGWWWFREGRNLSLGVAFSHISYVFVESIENKT